MQRPCGLHICHCHNVNVVFYILITSSKISHMLLILLSSTNKIVPCAPFEGSALRTAQGYVAPASADRGTPSPTSLWLVDLPPLAVCSFNSLYSALLAPSMQGRRLLVSPASSLSSFVPVCQRATDNSKW